MIFHFDFQIFVNVLWTMCTYIYGDTWFFVNDDWFILWRYIAEIRKIKFVYLFHWNKQVALLTHMNVKMIDKNEQCQPRSRKQKIIQVNCFFPLNWASTYDVSMSSCPSVKNKEKLVELPKVKSRFEGKPN